MEDVRVDLEEEDRADVLVCDLNDLEDGRRDVFLLWR